MPSRLTVYQIMCERLEITGHVADAVLCFHQMCREHIHGIDDKQITWTWGEWPCVQNKGHLHYFPLSGFKSRCSGKLGKLGDIAMDAKEYDEAILQYTTALSSNPANLSVLLSKRSEAHAGKRGWEDALNDANKVAHFHFLHFLYHICLWVLLR